MKFEFCMTALLAISTATGLFTEAVKTVLNEHKKSYHANTLAGICAVISAIIVCVAYGIIKHYTFNLTEIVYIVIFTILSWVCAMVGYDKVKQTISQFKGK